MVVVSGTFVFPAGTREKVAQAAAQVVAETRREKGCITYRFYADLEDENTYRVFEEWETLDDLKAHGKSAHLAAFRETLAGIGMISRDVKLYHVEKTSQL